MGHPLRIVAFNVYLPAYQLVAEWAARHGHQIALLVTLPSEMGDRYGDSHTPIVNGIPSRQDVLVTTRLRRTAAPVIAALAPDLIVSAAFPRRIPAEVASIPHFGAVNLHPAPLPRGRGPNPARLIYEGDTTIGAALHRISPEFDAGAILSRRERLLPPEVTGEGIMNGWIGMLREVLEEGTARAIAGEPGEMQDEALASYAAPFTEDERRLSWDEPARTVQRRAAALSMLGPLAWARIDGKPVRVHGVRARDNGVPPADPGTVLAREENALTVCVEDGVVEVTISDETMPTAAVPLPDTADVT